MAEVVLFHHAQGLTDGIRAFADALRARGHVVHTPDVHEGRTFATLDEGMAYVRGVGFEAMFQRGIEAAGALPGEVVYIGASLGAMPAESLAQSRAGAKGAVLLHAAAEPADLGGEWPAGLPLQVHVMEDDEWGDVDVARGLAETIDSAELFLYPGDRHLFTDRSLADYDEAAAALVVERVLAFLERVDAS